MSDSGARLRFKGTVIALALGVLLTQGCSTLSRTKNPYESSTTAERAKFKEVRLPFMPGTKFVVSQGAFGKATHHELGNEYQWDFDVPYGTPVVAVEDGTVIDIWEPHEGGGCDPKFTRAAHNIKVRHEDGTVAQYVHIESRVSLGQPVHEGQFIAVTAMNGYLCRPQLHFGIYRSDRQLYDSPLRESIPLRFKGVPGGIAREGYRVD